MQYKLIECDKFYDNYKIIEINEIEIYEDGNKDIKINTLIGYESFREAQINFNNCVFKSIVDIETAIYYSRGEQFQRIEFLYFKNCIFENNIRLFNELIEYELIFENCIFLGEVNLEKSVFENYLGFSNSIFFEGINLKDTSFDSRVSFRNVTLNTKNEFNLEETYINDKVEFIRICSKDLVQREYLDYSSFYKSIEEVKEEKYLNVKNRETARIIKDSFEQQNNIIEANKYYAIEMQKMEEELKKADKVKISEWLIFKIHGLTSNHSQDWLLALFWILSLSFGLAFINCINEYLDTKLEYMLIDTLVYSIVIILSVFIVQKEKINNFYLIGLFYLIYGFTTKDFTLYNIVNNINPFSIMTEFSELTFLTLVYKLTIAYLIYQLIVSIRQNTRRK